MVRAGTPLQTDYNAEELLQLAKKSRDGGQARRLLALAAILEGKTRTEAARIGGMDLQTLRDWVLRYNAHGPKGLKNRKSKGPEPRLNEDQLLELKELVIKGPDLEKDGVVRWRCIDLQAIIKQRYGLDYHERSIGKILHRLGLSHISARPQHPKSDPQCIETFKKLCR